MENVKFAKVSLYVHTLLELSLPGKPNFSTVSSPLSPVALTIVPSSSSAAYATSLMTSLTGLAKIIANAMIKQNAKMPILAILIALSLILLIIHL